MHLDEKELVIVRLVGSIKARRVVLALHTRKVEWP